MKRVRWIGVIVALLLGVQTLVAEPISRDDFWDRMVETRIWVARALASTGSVREDALTNARRLWDGVNQVNLEDDDTLIIDLHPFVRQLELSDDSALQQTLDQIDAWLAWERDRGGNDDSADPDALRSVMQDPRFDYATPAPEPTSFAREQQPVENTPQIPPAASGIAQTLSTVIQVVAFLLVAALVIGLLIFFGRALFTRPDGVKLVQDGEEAEPLTPEEAMVSAEDARQNADYRNAMRFAYLACLLELDSQGRLRYDRSLTNREHTQQLNNQPQLARLMESIVNTFDRVWYGIQIPDEEVYQTFMGQIAQARKTAEAVRR